MNDPIAILVGRLNAGWVLIDAESDGAKRARFEDHWIDLLHQYEAACDQDARAQKGIAA